MKPSSIYINWAAYDELSDKVELTEAIAMKQLDELLRLRRAGARFDYYLMDAFWYAPDGGYREWRKPHWPNGPDAWLDTCLKNDVIPGLWFSGNSLYQLKPVTEWQDSCDADSNGMCLFHGGFLSHWMDTVRQWYARGVRLYKLDFLQFDAAPEAIRQTCTPTEILEKNTAALRQALALLRRDCPEILFIGYNGLEEMDTQLNTDRPFRRTVDLRWLDGFDSLYCGDPRPADVPCMNFWRSKDIYSDHRVRIYEQNGLPFSRIDNCGFMVGTTGTCYHRGKEAWKGTFLLSLARGGWMNTYYGSLDLLSDEDGAWFGKAQSLFMPLQEIGRFETFGAMPGAEQPYGFLAEDRDGALITVVNPSQTVTDVQLPRSAAESRILFTDGDGTPTFSGNAIQLGPEQMALIGTGRFADEACDLGRSADIRIPRSIHAIPVDFQSEGDKSLIGEIDPPKTGSLRILLRQRDPKGLALRTSGGCAPDGVTLGQILCIEVEQNGQAVPTRINYDKAIWTGLSWAAAEVDVTELNPEVPIRIRCSTRESKDILLSCEVYGVEG